MHTVLSQNFSAGCPVNKIYVEATDRQGGRGEYPEGRQGGRGNIQKGDKEERVISRWETRRQGEYPEGRQGGRRNI